jgi:hypothetical protein
VWRRGTKEALPFLADLEHILEVVKNDVTDLISGKDD